MIPEIARQRYWPNLGRRSKRLRNTALKAPLLSTCFLFGQPTCWHWFFPSSWMLVQGLTCTRWCWYWM